MTEPFDPKPKPPAQKPAPSAQVQPRKRSQTNPTQKGGSKDPAPTAASAPASNPEKQTQVKTEPKPEPQIPSTPARQTLDQLWRTASELGMVTLYEDEYGFMAVIKIWDEDGINLKCRSNFKTDVYKAMEDVIEKGYKAHNGIRPRPRPKSDHRIASKN